MGGGRFWFTFTFTLKFSFTFTSTFTFTFSFKFTSSGVMRIMLGIVVPVRPRATPCGVNEAEGIVILQRKKAIGEVRFF